MLAFWCLTLETKTKTVIFPIQHKNPTGPTYVICRNTRQIQQPSKKWSKRKSQSHWETEKLNLKLKLSLQPVNAMTSASLSSSAHLTYGFPFFSILYLLTAIFLCYPNLAHSDCKNPPIIFNFGDSNSDTGGLVAGLGYTVNLPNGRAFFGRSTGRLSDGRLLIDFLCTFLFFRFISDDLYLIIFVNCGLFSAQVFMNFFYKKIWIFVTISILHKPSCCNFFSSLMS